MGTSTFSGPLKVGVREDAGSVVLMKQAVLVQNSTTAVTASVTVPEGSTILDIVVDNHVLWNSASSAVLSVGTAAAGTQYAGSVDLKTVTTARPTFTIAQNIAKADVGANTGVFITATPTGATSAGTTRVSIFYKMN